MPQRRKPPKTWVYSPPKPPKAKPPEATKIAVETRANALIESVLKPAHVKPPPAEPQFNYIVDIYGKWYRSYFYFCARYASPGPYAISPFFETRFARMEYVGPDRFTLSFMRYTGQWIELLHDQSLDDCLTAIESDAWFHP
jgi:hypothetical protein